MLKKYNIEVDCANCAAKMEEACKKVAGANSVQINFMMQKMTVDFAPDADEKTVLAAIEKTCKKVDRDFELKQ